MKQQQQQQQREARKKNVFPSNYSEKNGAKRITLMSLVTNQTTLARGTEKSCSVKKGQSILDITRVIG
ncbi:hypothetical protein CEXT_637611 [Caerostris extrusa]|uniref:Uncharacterized protein n=1 Tax=Caerostris extrusa TaxID=172846 RepID=A0AAV4RJQ4_CAEEX|nr:hypothetical protein CEXT_637611 [Caerostris extrusa]